jgi:hypothetical protein
MQRYALDVAFAGGFVMWACGWSGVVREQSDAVAKIRIGCAAPGESGRPTLAHPL